MHYNTVETTADFVQEEIKKKCKILNRHSNTIVHWRIKNDVFFSRVKNPYFLNKRFPAIPTKSFDPVTATVLTGLKAEVLGL